MCRFLDNKIITSLFPNHNIFYTEKLNKIQIKSQILFQFSIRNETMSIHFLKSKTLIFHAQIKNSSHKQYIS